MPIPLLIDLHQFSGWAAGSAARKLAGMFRSPDSIVNLGRHFGLTGARAWSRLLGATVFPPRCCLCGFEGQAPDKDLCRFCEADLPWDRDQREGCVTALRFEPPADELVRQLKYANALPRARVLGELLAQRVRDAQVMLPSLLVPVPLHAARLRERGFNQALAIARYAGRSLGIPQARNSVRRVRDTPSQTGLGLDERRRNVQGAFAVTGNRARRRLRESGHVAVVDDVMTTGSTLAELKALLLREGLARVDLWAVARVV
jgi:ComF family protein